MKDRTLSRAYRVTGSRMAAAFRDPLRRRLILLLAAKERSPAELAQITGIELKRLHYHVLALQRLCLLKVARTRKRAGRPIKYYRAVAEAFFVPDEVDASSPGEALMAELRRSLDRLRDPSREGTLYHLAQNAEPRMRSVGGTAPSEHWLRLRLSRADAARLMKDIEACLQSFAPREDPTAQLCLVHVAVAPSASLPGLKKPGLKKASKP